MQYDLEPLEDLTGDVFVNRVEELDLFWTWATRIPRRMGNSYALIGRRRTGKTSILVKLFNRLFTQQTAVMPVFISFARFLHWKRPLTMEEVASYYLSGYITSFFAFRYQRSDLFNGNYNIERLRPIAKEINDPIVNEIIEGYDLSMRSHMSQDVAQFAINVPRGTARQYNIPTGVIVDEFQVLTHVHDPKQGVDHDLTDSFQWAVDTWWAPMLVSGSAISLLVHQALTGMLQGRFNYRYLKPLSQDDTHELVFRMGGDAGVKVNEALAEAVWQFTGGYPYSIYSLINSDGPARHRLPDLDALTELALFELGNLNGKLWQHYDEEFRKYGELLNSGQATKKVMFWAVKYPDEQIDSERIIEETGLSFDEVQVALRKLHKADIVQNIGWTLYKGPGDPMLRRYIEYNYQREIGKLGEAEVLQDWESEYRETLVDVLPSNKLRGF